MDLHELKAKARTAETDEDFDELWLLLTRSGHGNFEGDPLYKVRRQSDGAYWKSGGKWGPNGHIYTTKGRAMSYAKREAWYRSRNRFEDNPDIVEVVEVQLVVTGVEVAEPNLY
jgi:hypothetical protein